ncbi:MAG: phosphoribosylformylglycinamidine synthase [Spirochaetaceae bacterium]|nr:phosphoribosylformylglycinamidine synthase [Spirochaetaceae bacterium]
MYRIYVERKEGFENEALSIKSELTNFLGIDGIKNVRYLNRYDVENVTESVIKAASQRIFSEAQSDFCYFEHIPLEENDIVIAWEYLPGQYDQRADSAEQCLSLLRAGLASTTTVGTEPPRVRCAKMVILQGEVSVDDVRRIEKYLINPVDSRLADLDVPESLKMEVSVPDDIPVQDGFIGFSDEELADYHKKMGLAMDFADIKFLQDYFKKINRDPTETEIKVLDTYWSDHCRHTTFNTVLDEIEIAEGDFKELFEKSLNNYKIMRTDVYAERADINNENAKPLTLMDMACIGAKYLKKHGKLDDIEISEEINACSIYIDVHKTNIETKAQETERWLLMFKNETHNHPTEIEPFGGAATCIGGAIRDPLSGRSWVYQALRVTGAADPTVPLSSTREGKLPQMKLTREAAQGFSSYGNQIGLTTGQVAEIYHPGFEAKRMELGAVIAASPADIVMRETPEAGDVIVLVGGGTGRDGIGGATGSSKVHNTKSVSTAAAEVQKGNAVEERKIQRLFRNPEVSKMIRRCNDFGAGGVAVAVGELAPGLEINLDAVPKKYEGLNGTELAISESQERMALVVRKTDVEKIIQAASNENLNATVIAEVTDTNRLVMKWRGKTIVDIERSFLDTAGASRSTKALIESPVRVSSPLCKPLDSVEKILKDENLCAEEKLKSAWLTNLNDLACCSQKGLSERFDGSIGAATVIFPMGGKNQSTPESGCAAKIPVQMPYETDTSSLMTFGYDPRVSSWSPWHGAQIAVLSSLAKITAMGGNPESCRLTFQEYFERTSSDKAWGKPTAALLGALEAQKAMGTASIGGKDSMSGTFEDLSVPPTLVSFAVTTENANNIQSGEFKKTGSYIYAALQPYTENLAPDFDVFKANVSAIYNLNKEGKILSMYTVGAGGIAEAVSKMSFGNGIGCKLNTNAQELLFIPQYGTILLETSEKLDTKQWLYIGDTIAEKEIRVDYVDSKTSSTNTLVISIEEAQCSWENKLEKVFPSVSGKDAIKAVLGKNNEMPEFAKNQHSSVAEKRSEISSFNTTSSAKPKVVLPVFPGTNCEFDMSRAFNLAGAETKIVVFRNHTKEALSESLESLEKEISTSQILALSGGFSAGDEPDGSGKFIANVLRENRIADSVMNLIKNRDGLVLGICNGFQALIKVGLVPYGEIRTVTEDMPTLTFNTIGRHISRVARTRLTAATSPWAFHSSVLQEGTHLVPISHGEGRIIISDELAQELFAKGQVFTQYTDFDGNPAIQEPDNPNGSAFAIEGLTSPDGRVLGKMGHSERTVGMGKDGSSDTLIKNIDGNRCQNIFAAGVNYFKK